MEERIGELIPLNRLRADVRKAARDLTDTEARYLVDLYYQVQEFRKGTGNQVMSMIDSDALDEMRSVGPDGTKLKFEIVKLFKILDERRALGIVTPGEPSGLLRWAYDSMFTMEKEIKYWLDKYTDNQPMGRWAKSIIGIGPVISAGLLAHIDIEPWRCATFAASEAKKPCREDSPHDNPMCRRERISTAGQVWRFAGLDPTSSWEKGQRRPWNANLKRLCWIIGDQFIKRQNNPDDIYGKVYVARHALEVERNERGDFADQAAAKMAKFKFGKQTSAYKHYSIGKLPPAHIISRARRYAVKLFLAHYHAEAYFQKYGQEPPLPYPIAILGHAHMIDRPNRSGGAA